MQELRGLVRLEMQELRGLVRLETLVYTQNKNLIHSTFTSAMQQIVPGYEMFSKLHEVLL